MHKQSSILLLVIISSLIYECHYRPLAVGVTILGGGHVGVQSGSMLSGKCALFPGYKATIADLPSTQRYEEKLQMMEGQDPYAVMQCQSLGWKILTNGKVQATVRLVCICHFF